MQRCCRCPDAGCLDRNIQCGECDEDGYPATARRRLKRRAGNVQDIDDQQLFRVKKTKTGERLVPTFDEPIKWSSAKGFAAMLLILSCLGAEGEYVLWDPERNQEMDEEGWRKRAFGAKDKPSIWHRACNQTVTSTSISSLQRGHHIGCKCHSTNSNHWRDRRAEVVQWGKERGFEVVTTEAEWAARCYGHHWCPTLRCIECNMVVTSTWITSLQRGQSTGCKCHSNHANLWRDRRAEVVQWGKERGFEVVTTEAEWAAQCYGHHWCPTLRCIECNMVVTSTSTSSLQRGQSIGCLCRNKTEAKLHEWLHTRFPKATITPQQSGPDQTRFDFHLTFPDGFEVIIELDGAQHFWVDHDYYTDAGCERDLAKEEWATAVGISVVRVLQEDVWADRLDWQGWLTRSIEAARTGEPRVLTPDAPEYRSSESAYVLLRWGENGWMGGWLSDVLSKAFR